MLCIKVTGPVIFFPEASCLCLPEKLWKKQWKISLDLLNMMLNIGLNTKKNRENKANIYHLMKRLLHIRIRYDQDTGSRKKNLPLCFDCQAIIVQSPFSRVNFSHVLERIKPRLKVICHIIFPNIFSSSTFYSRKCNKSMLKLKKK